MPHPFSATAVVPTSGPARYAKQLVSHLGRRCAVREEAEGHVLEIGDGACLVAPRDGALELRAGAASEEGLDGITEVVGSHLVRFGSRDGLRVVWQR